MKKQTRTGALLKGTRGAKEGGGRYRAGLGWAGPDRTVLTSALPQHPIAVRVDVPGASRSFTEPHGASAQQQRGLEPDRRGEETDSPARSARMHSLRSGAIPEAEPGAETVPTVRLSGPAR